MDGGTHSGYILTLVVRIRGLCFVRGCRESNWLEEDEMQGGLGLRKLTTSPKKHR